MRKPPYDKEHLPELDRWHQKQGTYEEWMLSQERALIAGNQVVRVITWKNLQEVCQASGLDEQKMIAAYKESLDTGDILFAVYEKKAHDAAADRC